MHMPEKHTKENILISHISGNTSCDYGFQLAVYLPILGLLFPRIEFLVLLMTSEAG